MSRCENTPSIPASLGVKATGRCTAESSAKLAATGGQTCYIELTNNTIHASPLTLRYYRKTLTGETDDCISTFLMKPLNGSKLIFVNYAFGDSISWNVEVSTSMDVDVADIICKMYC